MQNEKEKTGIRKYGEAILIVAIAFVMLFGAAGLIEPGKKSTVEEVTELSKGWYLLEQGEKKEISLPFTRETDGEEPLVLYNDSLTSEDRGKVLTTSGAEYGLEISLDDQPLYRYSDTRFPKNAQMKSKMYCDASIPVDTKGGTLTLTYHNPQQGKYEIGKVYMGTGGAVTSYHFRDTIVIMAITFIFLILGIIAIGIAIYLRVKQIEAGKFVYVALFLMICSVWLLTDLPVIQEESGQSAALCVISFYAFMLLAVPMLHFLRRIGNMKQYRMLDWCIGAFYINAVVQGILNYYQIFEFVEMLFVTHILLTVGVIVLTTLLIREYKREPDREVLILLTAFVTLAASGVLALLLYWVLEIPYYGVIFQFGIFVFVVLVLCDIIINMVANIHFKTEMLVYQRLSREDWMTGLENRQPFEDLMTEFQHTAEQFDNAALIFMDLNQLKMVNDEFGHAVGDEMIIAAARCITNTFGEEGSCYRIGGDEFCVVLVNPEKSEQEWLAEFDEEIRQFNKGSRYKLSIARGWSYLRTKEGTLKTISDWKYEADSRMYENKGGMRRV